MILAKYNKTKVEIPNNWKDITLKQAIELRGIELPVIEDSFDWFKYMDKVHKCITILTKIDVKKIEPSWLVYIFAKHLYPLILDLSLPAPETYKPKAIADFRHKGVTYLMPFNLEIGENLILQHGQNVKCFIESSNLLKQFSSLKSDGIKAMPALVASIVKVDKDEVFDEVIIAERAKEFESLTMDIVWEVFFCLSQLIIKFGSDTLQSMTKKNRMETIIQKLDMRLGRLQLRRAELWGQYKSLTT
jgi:hypothetical protein